MTEATYIVKGDRYEVFTVQPLGHEAIAHMLSDQNTVIYEVMDGSTFRYLVVNGVLTSERIEPRDDSSFLSYIETALGSSTDDEDEPLDECYGIDDFNAIALTLLYIDYLDFEEKAIAILDTLDDHERRSLPEDHLGHDFWLTRNGHGAGFWDGDWDNEFIEMGDRLTNLSKQYPAVDIYEGDDGLLYVIGLSIAS
ncbi:MAG: hypothetical protein F6K65_22260 [Moorea sp. SIO3C2]|nr:hypothetical protein [Moorena sp. SIO3C2]